MPRDSRLARLLQAVVLAHFAVAGAWAFWRWPVSPAQAVLGAAAVLLSGPIVLAAEFFLAARLNRLEASVPRAGIAEILKAWLLESAWLYVVFAWRQPFRWRAVPDHVDERCARRTGVVLVHGYMCNRGFWSGWMRRLGDAGHACIAVNLEPVFGSIDDLAPAIDNAVERVTQLTGRAPVLVCHSMGGLAARAWWRASAGARDVAALVTIASPHAGTWMGRFSTHVNGRQMRIGSDWLQELARHERAHPLPPTTCWYSNCDNIVVPAPTATLPRADNRFIGAEPHVALAFHPMVFDAVLALLAKTHASRQGESVTGPAFENG